jgi:hypothetical protein
VVDPNNPPPVPVFVVALLDPNKPPVAGAAAGVEPKLKDGLGAAGVAASISMMRFTRGRQRSETHWIQRERLIDRSAPVAPHLILALILDQSF